MKIELKVVTRIELEGNEELSAMRDICNIALTHILQRERDVTRNNDESKRDSRNATLIQGILEEIR